MEVSIKILVIEKNNKILSSIDFLKKTNINLNISCVNELTQTFLILESNSFELIIIELDVLQEKKIEHFNTLMRCSKGALLVSVTDNFLSTEAHELLLNGVYEYLTYNDLKDQFTLNKIFSHLNLLQDYKMKILQLENDNKKMIYNISHDLQSPLRHIINFTQILKEECLVVNNGLNTKNLNVVLSASVKMRGMITGILQLYRIGYDNISIKEVDSNFLFKNIVALLKKNELCKNCNIVINKLHKVYCDYDKFSILFYELLLNSIKFNDSSECQEVIISSNITDYYVEIVVKDYGIGIHESYFDKIFDIFSKLNNDSDYPGFGVGLSLCKKIMALHGGYIKIYPNQEKGSKIGCFFPKKRIFKLEHAI